MIPEISWAVGPSSRNHVQLSPWPPRAAPVKGRTIPTRPQNPQETHGQDPGLYLQC